MNEFLKKLCEIPPEELPAPETDRVKAPSPAAVKRIAAMTERKIAAAGDKLMFGYVNRRTAALRRAIVAVCAAFLLVGASVTVYAYQDELSVGIERAGEAIKRVFTREEALIDAKADIIDKTAVDGAAALTVEKAVRLGKQGYLYLTVTSEDGFGGGLFTCDSLKLERWSEKRYVSQYKTVQERNYGVKGIYAGDVAGDAEISEADEASGEYGFKLPLDITEPGKYRLTLERVFTTDGDVDENGEILVTPLADSLSVEFDVGELAESLETVVIEPQTEFELDGFAFTLETITISPIAVTVDISDRLGQTVTLGGFEFSALQYMQGFIAPAGLASNPEDYDKYREYLYTYHPKIWEYSYEFRIDLREGTGSVNEFESGTGYGFPSWENPAVRHTFALKSPVYKEDIERIYLVRVSDENDIVVLYDANNE